MTSSPLNDLTSALRTFAHERDWDQFHTPKNLVMALLAEAGELAELFQWLTPEQSRDLSSECRRKAELELADVFIYLLRLADKLNISLVDAATRKLELNRAKYPVEKSRGSAKKYTEFE